MSSRLSHSEFSRRGGKRCLETMTPEARRERARLAGLASAAARRKRAGKKR